VLTALNLRTMVNSVGPVLGELTSGLGLSGVQAGVVTALPVLCFAVLAAAGPPLTARFQDAHVLAGAALAMAAGMALRAFAGSFWFFLTGTVLAMSGGALGNVLLPGLVKRHFPHRIGAMVGAYGAAMALGAAIASVTTAPLTAAAGVDGWRWGLGVWAAFVLVAAVPWLLVPAAPVAGRSRRSALRLRGLLRSPTAVALMVFFGLQGALGYMVLGWSAEYLRDAGLDAADAGLLLGLHALVTVPLSAVVPALAARQRLQRPLLLTMVASSTVGWTGMALAPLTATWVWMVLLALGLAAFPMFLALLGLRARTPESTVALATAAQGWGYLIMGIGPLGVGVLHDLTGDYTGMFALAAVAVLGLLVSGWLATRPRFVDDEVVGPSVERHAPTSRRWPTRRRDLATAAGRTAGPRTGEVAVDGTTSPVTTPAARDRSRPISAPERCPVASAGRGATRVGDQRQRHRQRYSTSQVCTPSNGSADVTAARSSAQDAEKPARRGPRRRGTRDARAPRSPITSARLQPSATGPHLDRRQQDQEGHRPVNSPRFPCRGAPLRAENGARSPVDVVFPWSVEAVE
jgi:CP family cyanate transporter-like MFS transporter